MRFTKSELEDYIKVQQKATFQALITALLPSSQELTMAQIRSGITGAMDVVFDMVWEGHRHSLDVSTAEGVMYQLGGDDPTGQFNMTLLNEGDAGSIVIDGEDTGYQLVPIVTGSSVGGLYLPSDPFDGVSEIRQGVIDNTLLIEHDGQISLAASCLAEPTANNNKQLDLDICVFDSNGDPLRLIGFRSTTNNGNNGRANTINIPSVDIQDNTLIPAGSSIGLVLRKSAAETSSVTVTVLRSFVLISFRGLAKT